MRAGTTRRGINVSTRVSAIRAPATIAAALALMAAAADAQQVADSACNYAGLVSAYERGGRPRACIDGGHHHLQTAEGRYLAIREPAPR